MNTLSLSSRFALMKRTHVLRTSRVMIASSVCRFHGSAHLLAAEGFIAAANIGSLGQSCRRKTLLMQKDGDT
jgi:hypothetical protein